MALRHVLTLLFAHGGVAYFPKTHPLSSHQLGAAKSLPARHSPLRCAEEEPDTKRLGYYEGMLKSPLDARADEDLDNITPTVKFVGLASVVIGALLVAFLLANPPPSGPL